jgi:hypothetical protein
MQGDPGTLKFAAVVGGLVTALAVGYLVGSSSDEVPGTPAGSAAATDAGHVHAPGTDPDHPHVDGQVGGLAVSSGGFTLVPERTMLPRGVAEPFGFRIDGADGRPVTDFVVMHERPMHLLVVRRDLSGYQHLHPRMAGDGTWRVDLNLPTAGVWRAYADFTVRDPAGPQVGVKLGVDLTVPGDYTPEAIPDPAREASVGGYTVTYEGTPRVGLAQPLVFRVSGGAGAPPPTFEPYLGAYGHLVAIRDGDLAYVHVHADPQLYLGASKFWLIAPAPGRYRLFLDFQIGGEVHTATFTVVVTALDR